MEWQPIETAPLNQDVLVWEARPFIAWRSNTGWLRDNEDADLGYSDVHPTYWMPLPDPPKVSCSPK